ncbi:fibronectin type III domain-containing protein [Litoribacillus peritrichatus]|uniref:Fibronectin type-III domain-containing protein n=1 Tax=Litoribacillus peritrichatus TaxID=718191 RepID=A0ABP7MUV4_9GAMM
MGGVAVMLKHGMGVLSLVLILVLQGCGGGGGSSGDSSPSSDNEPSSNEQSQDSNQNTGLQAPQVANQTENDQLTLSWSDSNAQQYRVLYWQGNDAPQEFITSDLTFASSPLSAGSYQVLVEAYDEFGNSLFSTPMTVEVN